MLKRIRNIIPRSIWNLFFIDRWYGVSKWNAMANPPTYLGSNIRWKNVVLLLVILWMIYITLNVIKQVLDHTLETEEDLDITA